MATKKKAAAKTVSALRRETVQARRAFERTAKKYALARMSELQKKEGLTREQAWAQASEEAEF